MRGDYLGSLGYLLAPTRNLCTINMAAGQVTKPEVHGTMRHLHEQNIIHLLSWPFNIAARTNGYIVSYNLYHKGRILYWQPGMENYIRSIV